MLFPYSTELPECPYPEEIGNGKCDRLLINNPLCDYDGGDCCGESNIGNKCCENQNNFAICGDFDGGDCKSIDVENDDEYPHCPHNPKFIGDGVCDRHLAHRSQSFTSLMADLCEEINRASLFSRCPNMEHFFQGIAPLRCIGTLTLMRRVTNTNLLFWVKNY